MHFMSRYQWIKNRARYCKLMASSLLILLSVATPFLAASPVDENRKCVETQLTEKGRKSDNDLTAENNKQDVALQVKELLFKARRAEENAAWHDKRALVWEEINERQYATGDLVSGGDPLAFFFARTHRNQKEKLLGNAQSLQQKAQLLIKGKE